MIAFTSMVVGLIALIKLLTRRPSGPPPLLPPQGFPVQRVAAHYIVHGVDKGTRVDKSFLVIADSEAIARVKAELEGMVVTGVDFEMYVLRVASLRSLPASAHQENLKKHPKDIKITSSCFHLA